MKMLFTIHTHSLLTEYFRFRNSKPLRLEQLSCSRGRKYWNAFYPLHTTTVILSKWEHQTRNFAVFVLFRFMRHWRIWNSKIVMKAAHSLLNLMFVLYRAPNVLRLCLLSNHSAHFLSSFSLLLRTSPSQNISVYRYPFVIINALFRQCMMICERQTRHLKLGTRSRFRCFFALIVVCTVFFSKCFYVQRKC